MWRRRSHAACASRRAACPRDAFDAVAVRADAHDMRIVSSEIVGLVPASALALGDVEYLRLEGFEPEKQILERLVAAAERE